jgi:5'-nucleotidase
MRILVSNDDGIWAPGIRVLAERLSRDHEIYVVAPDRERSATGHALTLHKPLRVEESEIDPKIKGSWWTTGTPSDCVKFAVGCLLKDNPPDLVISGINSQPNLGGEILYSGTVSAAMEGCFLDIPSIAVSIGAGGHRHYDLAAEFISRLIMNISIPQSGHLFLNVNVPNVPASAIAGVRVTKLGVRAYKDYFEKRVDPRGKTYYWLAGEVIEEGEEEGTDCWCMSHKIISITPIKFDMTDSIKYSELQGLEQNANLQNLDSRNSSAHA